MRIRSHLVVLALVAVVPVAGIAAGLLVGQIRETRAAVESDLLRTARALAGLLDDHVRASVVTVQALATSPHLDGDDLHGFARQLQNVQAEVRPEWSDVAVVDATGRVLLWTGSARGDPLPSMGEQEHFRAALRGRPEVSDLIEASPAGARGVYLAVPVVRSGAVPLVVVVGWSPAAIAHLIEDQLPPDGGVAQVLDRRRRVIARVPAGAPDAPALDVEPSAPEGLIRPTSGSGPAGYSAFARAGLSGWTVTLAVPRAVVDAPVRRAAWGVLAAAGILGVTGVLAVVLAGRIARPLRELEFAAEEVGRGEVPAPDSGGIAEVQAVRAALIAAAGARRRAEQQLRAQAEEAERARQELARRREEAVELARVARLLTERLDLSTVAQRTVDALLPLLDAQSATLWLWQEGGTRVALASAGRARTHFQPGFVLPLGLGVVGRAAETGEPAWSADVFAEPDLEFPPDVRERIVGSGVRALLAVPLRIGDELIGIVTVAHQAPRAYGEHEIQIVRAFADQAALALDNARRFDAESAARARAEGNAARAVRLQAIAAALSRGLSRAQVSRIVAEQIVPALDAAACAVYVLSADGQALELVEPPGASGGALAEWSRLPLDRAVPLADAVRQARPWFQTRRAERDERYTHLRGIPTPHEAVAYVPLLLDDRPIGGLAIGFHAPRAFEEDDRRFILTVAQQCAQALDRARLHEAERSARAHAEAAQARSAFLAEASTVLASSLDPRTTLRQVARLSVPALADWCIVYLREPGGDVQRAEVVHADPAGRPAAERLRSPLPLTGLEAHTVVDRVLGAGEAVLFEEIAPSVVGPAGGPASLGALWDVAPRAAMFVPLGGGPSGRFGAIAFLTAESERRYGHADLALAADLARRLTLALDNARLFQAAEAASRAKDEFLAMLGHELRNPLGAIANAVAVLDEIGWPRPEAARLGQIVRRQVRHLSRLMDDLLDVSRVVVGRVTVERRRVDLAEVVDRCLATLREAGLRAGHTLDVQAAPTIVDGDPTRLAQVVNNLLENAIKYTPAGGKISIDVGAEDGEAVLRVVDTGMGIPPELLPHVFEPFTQERQRLDRSRGGLGLGLTLVRRLVELHGGTVSAASAGPGQGSTFTVRLPLAGVAATEPDARAPRPEPLPALRVLLIEDHEDARQSLRLLLERLGHEVHEAASGPRGLERLTEIRPDVALVDIGLPGLDGYELARTARGQLGAERPYLVALTGYGQPDDRRHAFDVGFDAHLVKPVSADDLTATLEAALRTRVAGRLPENPGA